MINSSDHDKGGRILISELQRSGNIIERDRYGSRKLPATLAIAAERFNTSRETRHQAFGNFQFYVYARVITLTHIYDTGVHEGLHDWSLPYQDYLAQFRAVVSDEHKDYLREMFAEEPALLVDPKTRQPDQSGDVMMACMAEHFHEVYGLGPAPCWTASPSRKFTQPDYSRGAPESPQAAMRTLEETPPLFARHNLLTGALTEEPFGRIIRRALEVPEERLRSLEIRREAKFFDTDAIFAATKIRDDATVRQLYLDAFAAMKLDKKRRAALKYG